MKYFAYGSNLCTRRLVSRVPSARKLGNAKLIGYQLRFHKKSKDGSARADALRTGDANDEVWGVVFHIKEDDIDRLDKFEGRGKGYERQVVEVVSTSGEKVSAYAYQAALNWIDSSLLPYSWYVRYVKTGAAVHGLPRDYVIKHIESISVARDPDEQREAKHNSFECGVPVRKLHEIADFLSGGTPSRKIPQYFRGTIPWITGNDVKGFRTRTGREFITEEAIQKSATHLVPKGSVLLVTRTGVGKVSIADNDICISQDLTGIIPKNGVTAEYLARYLLFISDKLKDQQRGTTISGITREVVQDLDIPLPSLNVQQRISEILDLAESIKEKRRNAIELTDLFLQSAFLEMFGDPVLNPKGWTKVEAGKLYEIKLGKMLDKKQFTGKHLRPYLRNINIQWGRFDLEDVQEMDFLPAEVARYSLKRGDILVCEGGEVGRCAIWNEQIPSCCYQKALHRLRPKTDAIDDKYFVNFMRIAAKNGLLLRDTSQVTIAHFTAEKFREFMVLLPPMDAQRRFSDLADQIEKLANAQEQAQLETDALFESLTQTLFHGNYALQVLDDAAG